MVLINLIKYHENNSEFNHFVIVLQKKGVLGEAVTNSHIEIYELGLTSLLNLPIVFIKLLMLIKRKNFDIIQTWMYHSDLIGGLAAYFIGKKNIIWSVRNSEILFNGGLSKSAIIISKICTILSNYIPKKIFYNSQIGKTNHEKLGYNVSKSIVIPNSINQFSYKSFMPNYFLNIKLKDRIVVGSVGRFNKYKDQLNFIKAANLLLKKNKNYLFVLIGKGNNYENSVLNNWIKETRYSDNFILLDEVQNIFEYYKYFDIFCLHSISEGFPNVLAEAMISGCLCVTTDVGDAKYIIGECGFVVNKSSETELAFAIEKISYMSSFEKKIKIDQSKKRIQNLFIDKVIYPKFENMYKEIIYER